MMFRRFSPVPTGRLFAAGMLAGGLAVGTLVVCVAAGPSAVPDVPASVVVRDASHGPQTATAGEILGFASSTPDGGQTVTLVHAGKSWMSVYHVGPDRSLTLVSSRPIDADFTLQLGVTDPQPDTLRALRNR